MAQERAGEGRQRLAKNLGMRKTKATAHLLDEKPFERTSIALSAIYECLQSLPRLHGHHPKASFAIRTLLIARTSGPVTVFDY